MRRVCRTGVACLLALLLFSCISTGETVESSQQDQPALDAGAEDMETTDDAYVITTSPEDYDAVEKALADHNIEVAMSELSLIPDNTIAVTGEDAEKVQNMIDAFNDLDDVQDVYTNADLPEEE